MDDIGQSDEVVVDDPQHLPGTGWSCLHYETGWLAIGPVAHCKRRDLPLPTYMPYAIALLWEAPEKPNPRCVERPSCAAYGQYALRSPLTRQQHPCRDARIQFQCLNCCILRSGCPENHQLVHDR